MYSIYLNEILIDGPQLLAIETGMHAGIYKQRQKTSPIRMNPNSLGYRKYGTASFCHKILCEPRPDF